MVSAGFLKLLLEIMLLSKPAWLRFDRTETLNF